MIVRLLGCLGVVVTCLGNDDGDDGRSVVLLGMHHAFIESPPHQIRPGQGFPARTLLMRSFDVYEQSSCCGHNRFVLDNAIVLLRAGVRGQRKPLGSEFYA